MPLLSYAFEQEPDAQSAVQHNVQLTSVCNMTEMIAPILKNMTTPCTPQAVIVMPSRMKQACLQVIDLHCNVMPSPHEQLVSFTGEHAGISWVLHGFLNRNNRVHALLSLMKPY